MTRSKNKILDIQKLKKQSKPFATITAYDFPTAKIINTLNIPLVLVGDSASMVVYGYQDTTPISMEEMLLITKAVARGIDNALLVGDMPFMSYQPSVELAIINAGKFIKVGGVDAVKLEGGIEYIKQIEGILKAGVPVMGHVGLKPQSVLIESGYRVQGKTAQSALKIFKDALALQKAGVFAIVLEGVPEDLAQIITDKLTIPTIGIGAGRFCDGQIQVFHDVVGLLEAPPPKHAHAYINSYKTIMGGLQEYQRGVIQKIFPENKNIIKMDKNELIELKKKIDRL